MAKSPSRPQSSLSISERERLTRIAKTLRNIIEEMLRLEESILAPPHSIHPQHLRSARNLAHYLALRRHDLRSLQSELAALGLSSLGRSEGHTLHTLQRVHHLLCTALDSEDQLTSIKPPVRIGEGSTLLAGNTRALLGTLPSHRSVGIMVTMATEAATDYGFVRRLVQNGMDCMRINCARDNPRIWLAMIRNLEKARAETGRRCKVQIDLAGPKLRTGPLPPGPAVIRCRPERDSYGRVVSPARLWLAAPHVSHPTGDLPVLRLPEDFLARLRREDRIEFRDARDSRRTLHIVRAQNNHVLVETRKTCYFTTGLRLTHIPARQPDQHHKASLGPVPSPPLRLRLKPGDTLLVERACHPGRAAQTTAKGRGTPARIGVTLPDMLQHAKAGESIWFDDGKIGGVIRSVTASHLRVEIIQARSKGEWLAAGKGINLPDTHISMPALTAADLENLKFIAAHADILGYSFVRRREDVRELIEQLHHLNVGSLPIVLKIETREAFENLPSLLLEAMQVRGLGVMIARGDLAVECGYQRLAEVQEEILWICEAAHLPVIWATQVLDFLAKKGIPSRAEITDAAMAERAECVMLNKGPYIDEAVRALDDILTRMQAHQEKKRSMLRRLSIAAAFSPNHKPKATSSKPRTASSHPSPDSGKTKSRTK